MYNSIKHKVHLLLDPSDGGTSLDKIINAFLVSLIILNTTAVILETVESIYSPYKSLLGFLKLFQLSYSQRSMF